MKQVTARVISNQKILGEFKRPDAGTHRRPEARNIVGSQLLRLECPGIAREARPGQYVMVYCGPDCTLPRPFSLHWVKGDEIALFYAVWEGGLGTGWLEQQKKGSSLNLLGPLGNGFSVKNSSRQLLLVAGGIGIAPLCFLAQRETEQGRSVTLLYGTASDSRYPGNIPPDLLPVSVETLGATEDGSVGKKGFVTDLISEHIELADQVFACGPLAMYQDMYRQRERLFRGKPVHVSLEVRLGCGFGVCYGCSVKTKAGLKQVCHDGPVFALDDIVWDELSPV